MSYLPVAAVPPDNDALGLYQYVGSLTRPVRYRSETDSQNALWDAIPTVDK